MHLRHHGRRPRHRSVLLAVTVLLAALCGLLPSGSALAFPDADPGTSGAQQAPAAAAGTMRSPVNTGPDPFMAHYKGRYYLATTQGDRIRMWSAASAADLLRAEPKTVWLPTDPSRNKQVWAPEFYLSNGRWYLYCTASDGVDEHHRLYVAESEGDDPMGPYHFKSELAPPNHLNDFAIDAAVMQRGQPVGAAAPAAAGENRGSRSADHCVTTGQDGYHDPADRTRAFLKAEFGHELSEDDTEAMRGRMREAFATHRRSLRDAGGPA